MNWVLIIINLLIFSTVGLCQECIYNYDSANTDTIKYLEVDSSIIKGNKYILLIENLHTRLTYYKFENKGDSIIITVLSKDYFDKISLPGFLNIQPLNNGKLYISGETSSHKFEMIVIKNNNQVFQLIPYVSTFEHVIDCIHNYDNALYQLVKKVLQLKAEL